MVTKLKIGHKRHSRSTILSFEMDGLSVKNVQKVDWLQDILKSAYDRHLFLENSPEEFALLESCGTFFEPENDLLIGWIVTLDTIEYQNYLKELIRTYTKVPFKKDSHPIKTFKEIPEYFLPRLTHTLATLPNSVLAISDILLSFRFFLLHSPQRYATPCIQNLEDFKNILFELEKRIPDPWLQGKRYSLKIEEERLKQVKDSVESGNYASLFNCLSGTCFFYSTRLGLRAQNRYETIRLLNLESATRKTLDITVLSELVTITGYKNPNQPYDFKIGQRGLFAVPITYKNRKRLQIVSRPTLIFISVNDSSGLIDKIWIGYDDYEFELKNNLYSLQEYLPRFVREENDQNEYTFITTSPKFIGLGNKDRKKNKILCCWGTRLNGRVIWRETLKPLENLLEKAHEKKIFKSKQEEILFLKRVGFTITEDRTAIYCWGSSDSPEEQYKKAERFIDETIVTTSLIGTISVRWPK